jgi:hypothetical protein
MDIESCHERLHDLLLPEHRAFAFPPRRGLNTEAEQYYTLGMNYVRGGFLREITCRKFDANRDIIGRTCAAQQNVTGNFNLITVIQHKAALNRDMIVFVQSVIALVCALV